MQTCAYVCSDCKALFELTVPDGTEEEKEAKCTECASTNIERLNVASCSIAPPASQMLMWQYVCHQCEAEFEVPVPRGPKEEREMKCTRCGSMNIERVRTCGCDIAPPGG